MLRFCPVQNVFGWHAHILWQLSPNSARIIEPWEFQAVQSYKSASTVSHVKQSKENESMTYNGWYTKTTSLLWALACRIIFIWNLCISKVRGQQHIQNLPRCQIYILFFYLWLNMNLFHCLSWRSGQISNIFPWRGSKRWTAPSAKTDQHAPETGWRCAGVQPHLETVMSAPASGSITKTFLKQTRRDVKFRVCNNAHQLVWLYKSKMLLTKMFIHDLFHFVRLWIKLSKTFIYLCSTL